MEQPERLTEILRGCTAETIPSSKSTRTPLPLQKREKSNLVLIEPGLIKEFELLAAGDLPWPLFLYGKPGTGKTFAVCAFANHIGHFGSPVDSLPAICEGLIENQRSDDYKATHGFFQDWEHAALSILDDLGTRRASDFQHETLITLLNLREDKPLILVSNLDLAGIAGVYDDRVASRMGAGTVFELTGKDRRIA